MNLGTKLQYTLAYFISFMLQSVFYGKYRLFGLDTDLKGPTYRYVLRDIRCIRKDSTQEST